MKDVVLWVMMVCFLVGTPIFFLGQFIEKTIHLIWLFKGEDSQSKLGVRLFWCGAGLFSLGILLALFVYPKSLFQMP